MNQTTRLFPSGTARKLLEAQGVDLNDAIYVVRHYKESWAGNKPGQLWCQGVSPNQQSLKVLIAPRGADAAIIVTVRILKE